MVTIRPGVKGIKLNLNNASLTVGKTVKLRATVEPADAFSKDVTWKSSNAAVATVAADGTVKGTGKGTATITVTTKNNSKKASCRVTVTEPVPKNGWLEAGGRGLHNGWRRIGNKDYWYEKGQRQGMRYDRQGVYFDGTNRGREICDLNPATRGWYLLDANADGAKAVSKEVMMPYTYKGADTVPKWVRYDEKGAMIKGWYTDTVKAKTVYYDLRTGAMAKGKKVIDGKTYVFNNVTGSLIDKK